MDFTDSWASKAQDEIDSSHIESVIQDMERTAEDLTARQQGDSTAQRIRGWVKILKGDQDDGS